MLSYFPKATSRVILSGEEKLMVPIRLSKHLIQDHGLVLPLSTQDYHMANHLNTLKCFVQIVFLYKCHAPFIFYSRI